MFLSQNRSTPVLPILLYCACGGMFVLALVLRVLLFPIETSDYTIFLSQWYDFIQTHGGLAALQYNFSNYNIPYLFLLALLTFLPLPKLVAIKALSVLFDGVLSLFAYLILRLRYRRFLVAGIGALAVLFAPTIFINSAAWGQCDSIYAAFCLGSLYFLLKERPAWACVFFGLAIAFKLQAIFFLPVLLVLVLKRRLALQYLVLIPLVFLLLLLPALLAGRDIGSVLTIYVGQVESGGTGGAGQFPARQFNQANNNGGPGGFNQGSNGPLNNDGGQNRPGNGGSGPFNGRGAGNGLESSSALTLNAPSFYQWLPAGTPDYWKEIGIALAALLVVLVGGLLVRSKQPVTTELVLKIALVFVLGLPFLLPEMHERYFYLADVISIIAAFYFPRLFYIAILMQVCSLLSYAPYLLNSQVISLAYVADVVLVIVTAALIDLLLALYPDMWKARCAALHKPGEP